MNTAQLECFLTVAQTLNFARAAEQLHITQPAVTQQIQSLEKELGVQLFHRTTHSVRLTDEGTLFLADARQITAIATRSKKRFSLQADRPVEPLFIGCMHAQTMNRLKAPLTAMGKEYPAFHPLLQIVPFQHIFRLLDEGTLDVVADFQMPVESTLLYKELLHSPMVCICPQKHLLASREQVTLADLKTEPLVLPAPTLVPTAVRRQQEALLEERPPVSVHLCESIDTLGLLIACGYGVSILPQVLVPDLPDLKEVPLEGGQPVSFGLYYKSLKERPLLKAFIHCAQETLHDESLNMIN